MDFQSTQLLLWRKYEITIIPSTTNICLVNIKYIHHCSISMPFYKHNNFLWLPNHSEIFLQIFSTTNSVSVAPTMHIIQLMSQCCEQPRRSWFMITTIVLAGRQCLWDTSRFQQMLNHERKNGMLQNQRNTLDLFHFNSFAFPTWEFSTAALPLQTPLSPGPCVCAPLRHSISSEDSDGSSSSLLSSTKDHWPDHISHSHWPSQWVKELLRLGYTEQQETLSCFVQV